MHIHQIFVSGGGVPKQPVDRAEVTAAGVSGDAQSDPLHHGGPERAVCLFSLAVIETLQAEGHPIAPGATGENLTLAGLSLAEWAKLGPGNRLKIGGGLEIEVTGFANPCHKIAACFAGADSSRISPKLHPGWSRLYAQVISAGAVKKGDPVEIL